MGSKFKTRVSIFPCKFKTSASKVCYQNVFFSKIFRHRDIRITCFLFLWQYLPSATCYFIKNIGVLSEERCTEYVKICSQLFRLSHAFFEHLFCLLKISGCDPHLVYLFENHLSLFGDDEENEGVTSHVKQCYHAIPP
ncbi:hypothetical protein AS006_01210 [Thermotoga sp. SG1]|nr:hypothetical protein AS006_01210 [Thermotoga sp. SG1]